MTKNFVQIRQELLIAFRSAVDIATWRDPKDNTVVFFPIENVEHFISDALEKMAVASARAALMERKSVEELLGQMHPSLAQHFSLQVSYKDGHNSAIANSAKQIQTFFEGCGAFQDNRFCEHNFVDATNTDRGGAVTGGQYCTRCGKIEHE